MLLADGEWHNRGTTGFSYYYSNETATFLGAKAACAEFGAELAYVKTQAEQNFLLGLTPGYVQQLPRTFGHVVSF